MAPRKAAKKDVAEPKATVVKETAVKEVAAKEAPAKKAEKAPAKKTTVLKEQVVLQFAGKDVDTAEIIKQVKKYWTKELKYKVGDMKSVTLYLKPEESKAYFVVNGDVTGSIEL